MDRTSFRASSTWVIPRQAERISPKILFDVLDYSLIFFTHFLTKKQLKKKKFSSILKLSNSKEFIAQKNAMKPHDFDSLKRHDFDSFFYKTINEIQFYSTVHEKKRIISWLLRAHRTFNTIYDNFQVDWVNVCWFYVWKKKDTNLYYELVTDSTRNKINSPPLRFSFSFFSFQIRMAMYLVLPRLASSSSSPAMPP